MNKLTIHILFHSHWKEFEISFICIIYTTYAFIYVNIEVYIYVNIYMYIDVYTIIENLPNIEGCEIKTT